MPKFSQTSLRRLATCHADLQRVLNRAIRLVDFTVLEGHRSQAAQDQAFREGKSKVRWPNSKHNLLPSRAVDIAPWPIDWNDHARFHALARIIIKVAELEGVKLRWGGDWDGDGKTRSEGDKDERFVDLPHFELAAAPAANTSQRRLEVVK